MVLKKINTVKNSSRIVKKKSTNDDIKVGKINKKTAKDIKKNTKVSKKNIENITNNKKSASIKNSYLEIFEKNKKKSAKKEISSKKTGLINVKQNKKEVKKNSIANKSIQEDLNSIQKNIKGLKNNIKKIKIIDQNQTSNIKKIKIIDQNQTSNIKKIKNNQLHKNNLQDSKLIKPKEKVSKLIQKKQSNKKYNLKKKNNTAEEDVIQKNIINMRKALKDVKKKLLKSSIINSKKKELGKVDSKSKKSTLNNNDTSKKKLQIKKFTEKTILSKVNKQKMQKSAKVKVKKQSEETKKEANKSVKKIIAAHKNIDNKKVLKKAVVIDKNIDNKKVLKKVVKTKSTKKNSAEDVSKKDIIQKNEGIALNLPQFTTMDTLEKFPIKTKSIVGVSSIEEQQNNFEALIDKSQNSLESNEQNAIKLDTMHTFGNKCFIGSVNSLGGKLGFSSANNTSLDFKKFTESNAKKSKALNSISNETNLIDSLDIEFNFFEPKYNNLFDKTMKDKKNIFLDSQYSTLEKYNAKTDLNNSISEKNDYNRSFRNIEIPVEDLYDYDHSSSNNNTYKDIDNKDMILSTKCITPDYSMKNIKHSILSAKNINSNRGVDSIINTKSVKIEDINGVNKSSISIERVDKYNDVDNFEELIHAISKNNEKRSAEVKNNNEKTSAEVKNNNEKTSAEVKNNNEKRSAEVKNNNEKTNNENKLIFDKNGLIDKCCIDLTEKHFSGANYIMKTEIKKYNNLIQEVDKLNVEKSKIEYQLYKIYITEFYLDEDLYSYNVQDINNYIKDLLDIYKESDVASIKNKNIFKALIYNRSNLEVGISNLYYEANSIKQDLNSIVTDFASNKYRLYAERDDMLSSNQIEFTLDHSYKNFNSIDVKYISGLSVKNSAESITRVSDKIDDKTENKQSLGSNDCNSHVYNEIHDKKICKNLTEKILNFNLDSDKQASNQFNFIQYPKGGEKCDEFKFDNMKYNDENLESCYGLGEEVVKLLYSDSKDYLNNLNQAFNIDSSEGVLNSQYDNDVDMCNLNKDNDIIAQINQDSCINEGVDSLI